MAKIAGRKNDGAWFRWNKWIIAQPSSTQAAFVSACQGEAAFQNAFMVINDYITEVGVQPSAFPSTVQEWITELSVGIPRQLWDGVTTYDFYERDEVGPNVIYVKLMQGNIFTLSKVIRKICKRLRFGETEVSGLAGLTRPTPSLRHEGETMHDFRGRRLIELRSLLETEEWQTIIRRSVERGVERAKTSIATNLADRAPKGRGIPKVKK